MIKAYRNCYVSFLFLSLSFFFPGWRCCLPWIVRRERRDSRVQSVPSVRFDASYPNPPRPSPFFHFTPFTLQDRYEARCGNKSSLSNRWWEDGGSHKAVPAITSSVCRECRSPCLSYRNGPLIYLKEKEVAWKYYSRMGETNYIQPFSMEKKIQHRHLRKYVIQSLVEI